MNVAELRQMILGCLAVNGESPITGNELAALAALSEDDFDSIQDRKIFNTVLSLRHANEHYSLNSLATSAKASFEYVATIASFACHEGSLMELVRQLRVQTRVNKLTKALMQAPGQIESLVTLKEKEEFIDQFVEKLNKESHASIRTANGAALGEALDSLLNEKNLIDSHDSLLNHLLKGGFRKPGINILAGQSGTGKTTIGARILHRVAMKSFYNSAFFSLEMTLTDIAHMLMAEITGKSRATINSLPVAEKRTLIEYAQNALKNANTLRVVENKAMTIEFIEAKCRSLHCDSPLDVVFMDFFTAMQSNKKFNGETEKYNYIMSKIGSIASDLNVSVMLLAQLNRTNQQSKDFRPTMHQLKGTSAIENFADLILFAHRPGQFKDSIDDKWLELIVAKNRYGELGSIFYESIGGTIYDTAQDRAKRALFPDDYEEEIHEVYKGY